MTDINLDDGTSISFDPKKYNISFWGMQVFMYIKPEFDIPNRPKKIGLNYTDKTFTQDWDDADSVVHTFTGVY